MHPKDNDGIAPLIPENHIHFSGHRFYIDDSCLADNVFKEKPGARASRLQKYLQLKHFPNMRNNFPKCLRFFITKFSVAFYAFYP